MARGDAVKRSDHLVEVRCLRRIEPKALFIALGYLKIGADATEDDEVGTIRWNPNT